ncbi:hypothetical protein HMI55_001039 [Coelomomyces lativittatus]|nr:hypothetical protein HMI55_001039 [Coelomomyces lativittatus]
MSKNKLLFLLNRGCCFKKTTIDTTTTTIFPLTLPGSILLKRFSSSSSSTSTTTSNPNFNSNSSSSFTITSSPPQSIDTYQYVQALEQEGFSKEQSESLVQSFSEIINHRSHLG